MSTLTAEPSRLIRTARSLRKLLIFFRTKSKPRNLRSATKAPRSAGCSHALELIPVRTMRSFAFSAMVPIVPRWWLRLDRHGQHRCRTDST